MALPVNETFLQSSGNPQPLTTFSPNFTILVGNFSVPSGGSYVSPAAGGVDGAAWWNADAFPDAQFSEVVMAVGWVAAGIYVGPACRLSAAGGYGVEANSSNWYLGRFVGTVWSTIASGTWSGADGSVLRIEASNPNASTARLRVLAAAAATPTNFTQLTTFDDTSADRRMSGSAGIAGYDNTSSPGIDILRADALPAPSAQITHRNGILLSGISHINGIAKAGISHINGLTI